MTLFAVIRARGPAWDDAQPIERQHAWDAHARFMDDLYARNICVFAGPLAGTREALVVMRAESENALRSILNDDPWTTAGLLTLSRLHPWTLRLGSELVEVREPRDTP